MAKKPVKKKATKKVVESKPKKLAKKAAKKASKKQQMIIDFLNEKGGTTVKIKGVNVSTKLMMMAHDALGQAIASEMLGSDKG